MKTAKPAKVLRQRPPTKKQAPVGLLVSVRCYPHTVGMGYGARKLDHPATLADIDALQEGGVGEIIDGTLYAHPRPMAGHSYLESRLIAELDGPFQRGRGGRDGCWLSVESR
ncbi:hypothetical protein [Myxococcus sp. AM010]|uniref:hypothetical protein n=1 Tax=Myxococcus sp. AM010 TaxID=2745138 RepID=UPI0026E5423D|nr:hypothetical protein [Myxococcus sp. AM010]